ncbi:MAG: hypothetical protein R3F11_10425 [Verrucomicrobiales bacterium]
MIGRLLAAAKANPKAWAIYYGGIAALAAALVVFLALTGGKAAVKNEAKMAEREAAGTSVPVELYAAIYLRKAALLNLALLGGMAALGPLALRRFGEGFAPSQRGVPKGARAIFWLGAGLATAGAAFMLDQRLDQSLWGDEEYTMRKAVVGDALRDKTTGVISVDPVPWSDTLWRYRNPNNHILASILARLSHGGPVDSSDPAQTYFSERRLRLPGMVVALAAVPLLGYFMASLGFVRAAIPAMFLFALHPWFVRYGAEVRGYALLLALVPAALALMLRACRGGGWRSFLGFAFCLAGMLYAFPGALYLAACFGVALAALLWWRTADGAARLTLFARFAAAHLLAAAAFLQLFLPCVPQFLLYLKRDRAMGEMGAGWLADAVSSVGFGVPWHPWGGENPVAFSLADLASQAPASVWIAIALVAGGFLYGCWRLFAAAIQTRVIVIALVLPAALTYTHNALSGNFVYLWYLMILLPGFAAIACTGIDALADWVKEPRFRGIAALGIGAAFVAVFAAATAAPRAALLSHPVEPLRDSVAEMRGGAINPLLPGIDDHVITAGFFMQALGYDPAQVTFSDAEGLEQVMRDALRERKKLYVHFALYDLGKKSFPEIFAILEDPAKFTPREEPWWGQSESSTRYVFEMVACALMTTFSKKLPKPRNNPN